MTPWSLGAGDNEDWAPDGKWILFGSYEEVDSKQSQIYLVHPDGSGLRQLTHFKRGAIVTSSSFSPDGKWIVFATTGVGGNADLFVIRPDGKRHASDHAHEALGQRPRLGAVLTSCSCCQRRQPWSGTGSPPRGVLPFLLETSQADLQDDSSPRGRCRYRLHDTTCDDLGTVEHPVHV